MVRLLSVLLFALWLQGGGSQKAAPVAASSELSYAADGQMKFPANYREWIYLTSGLGMNYNPGTPPDHPMFDNVFVNPSAYKAFLQTGTWPDKTVIVLEVRGSETKASIDQSGHSQSPELMGVEVHVKDEARLPGKWGFFEFGDSATTAKVIARPATCYTCHEAHGAVDTTFVQFYPTLIGLAQAKKTLSPEYLKERPATAKPASGTKY
jgi:hypothetical protein